MASHPDTARLVIEISISTESLDREKAPLYAEAGIPEYWIVLPARNAIEQFTQPLNGQYLSHRIIVAEATCTSTEFAGLQVRLADWLA